MKIHKVDKDEMEIPSKWLIREYLALDLPVKFRNEDIKNNFKDKNNLNQFLNQAVKFNLVVRLKRGLYFAPEPDVVIKTWAMDGYHSRLILLNSAFEALELGHAFYCMSSTHYTDYSPEKVIPVLREDHEDIDQNHIDHFVYDFSETKEQRLEAYETSFSIPLLSKEDTAILLFSTYMQREIDAGKEILEDIDLDPDLRGVLAGLGYDRYSKGEFNDIDIKKPLYIQEWIKEIGLENVKERAGR